VTSAKQRTISKVASYYCLTHGYGTFTPCRFDVAAVLGEQIKVIQNAFDYQGF
jgi:putative endonuclease